MDPTKPQGEACTSNGGLKEADEIAWFNDPDDESAMMGRSNPPRRSHTQSTLGAFGVITPGQNSTKDHAIGNSTHGAHSTRLRVTRTRKLPAKFKDALTSDVQISKTTGRKTLGKRNVVADDEDKVQPRKKKKTKTRTPAGDDPGSRSKTRVFSPVSEDTHDTHANTEGSDNSDLGNMSTGEANGTDTRGWASDEEEEWDFSQLDDMAVKDAKAYKKPKLFSSTGGDIRLADLIAIFKDGEHPDGNVDPRKQARKCKLCNAWFIGNSSTCRTHIMRQWTTHREPYLDGCKFEEVEPNERVMTADRERTGPSPQGSLEGWTVAKTPQWSKWGLMEHIVELVVVDDQAFSLVDRVAFRRLLTYQRPATKDSEIPHRTSIAKAVHEKAYKVKEILKGLFATVPGEVSVTLDGWSSPARDPYLGVTVHWVQCAQQSPTDWTLRTLLLAFREIKGNHGGDNLAELVMTIFEEAGLASKIGWITSDNVTSNDKMMACLEDKLDSIEHDWKAQDRRVRCLAHIVHLAAKHIVQAFSQDDPLTDSDFLDAPPADVDEDSETSYVSGDTLGKLWAFVNQVRLSPQASAFFFRCCAEEGLPRLELIKYVRTRWSSMYDLLERAFKLKAGITKFINLADESRQVPDLQKKSYSDYRLSSKEWVRLDLLCQILKHPALAQQQFSSQRAPTVFRVFPIIEFLLTSLEAAEKDTTFKPIRAAISAGVLNLTKWYQKLDTCPVYMVCNVLDPSMKLAYIKKHWGPQFVLRARTILATIFDKYNKASEDTGEVIAPSLQPATTNTEGYGSSWMQLSLNDDSDDEEILDPRKELTSYLDSRREEAKEGLVEWWGHNSNRYPTISRIARDYLAIQASSVASERAFSSGRLTGTYLRNQLKTDTFEALQIVKSAFRNGILDADDEAAGHVAAEWNFGGLVETEDASDAI